MTPTIDTPPPIEHRLGVDERVPVVVVKGLHHSFGEGEAVETVLRDTQLTLGRGEVVVLTGPSGSGKTTLLTLIGALRSIQQGSIEFAGRQLAGLSARAQEEVRRRIGFIFQTHNLFDSLTAFQNVKLATELFPERVGDADARARTILERLGLGEYQGKKPPKLSEGQRQRVAIGRALVNDPELVLADEPTAALDRAMGRAVVEVLRERADRAGTTVLIVTHDNRILDVADRVVEMLEGKVVAERGSRC